MLRHYSARTLNLNDSSSLEAHAHTSRGFHSSFPVPSSAVLNQCPDRRPPFAVRREYLPSRRSRPDCLPQTGSRQARSTRRRTAGTLLRTQREFFLPHSPAGYANALPIPFLRRDPSRCGTNHRRVAVKLCPPYPPAKPSAREYPSATPKRPQRSPAPTVHHKDCQTPSKYKSPARNSPPPFPFATFQRAASIRPASCWHSRAENTPISNTDTQWSSPPAWPAPAPILFRSPQSR